MLPDADLSSLTDTDCVCVTDAHTHTHTAKMLCAEAASKENEWTNQYFSFLFIYLLVRQMENGKIVV